jgi:UDP-N-acetylmuramoyl-tripeptide--D-alanyl-D-alanine ligase
MKGMTIRAMTQACHGIYHGDEGAVDIEISAITTDSRKIQKNGVFIAICGEKSDGHDYIGKCFDDGALCCISERELPGESRPYIQVESSLTALKQLAAYYRQQLDIKVVGITGSVGKTSTKETIASVLAQKYKVKKTQGNFNNEIGLPLTVFTLEESDEIAVLEMGISDFGEMTRLTAIACPDVCVITNIGWCHLENLKTRDGILKAKTEIFNHMNPDGIVIVNGDDDKLSTISQVHGKRPLVFGISNKDGVYADNIKSLGLDGTSFTIHGIKTSDNYSTFDLTVPVPGHHMVYNAMAAALVGSVLGLSSIEIERGVKNLKTIAGRNNIIKENGFTIIDDCYNANPVSMKASLDVLDTAIGRKVAILGSMFELGENEKQMHYDVGMYLGTKDIDVLITAGELAAQIAEGTRAYIDTNYNAHGCEVHDFETRDDMLKCIGHILKTGDNILIKASHGMEFTKVVEAVKTINL